MLKEINVSLYDLISCLSQTMDLISPSTVNHHKEVSYIALSIAQELGLPEKVQQNLVMAGLLHDMGIFSLKEKLDSFNFEFEEPHEHALLASYLLSLFKPFEEFAPIIEFHHHDWKDLISNSYESPLTELSNIIFLSDRTAVLSQPYENILDHAYDIIEQIKKHTGKKFSPEYFAALQNIAGKQSFWLDIKSRFLERNIKSMITLPSIEMDTENMLAFGKFIRQSIDFRSRFTATHSSGVAAVAEALARIIGFSDLELEMIYVAGCLHDLGKMAVPKEILEKPGKLTNAEFNVIRSHTYYTYHSLETISEFDTINKWASLHHERLDGTGYPFHYKKADLPLGSRIMSVADVFTAIAEDRPYRKGMNTQDSLKVLEDMSRDMALDSDIVLTLEEHFDDINALRITAQNTANLEYQEFYSGIKSA
jgi:HD-GYP domain-containing protein (c-di-GMP phosphodiesterase class II)